MNENANVIRQDFDYRTLFDQNLAGIYQTTAKGTIVNCNEAFVRMLKYLSKEELLKTSAFALYFSDVDRNNFIDNVRQRKRLANYECILKCKDGSPLYVIENIFLRTDTATGEEYCDGIIIDISERKLAELQLKETNLKYQAIIDNPMNGFIMSDNKGDLLEANNSACEMFGYTKQEVVKLNRKDILDVDDPKFIKAMAIRNETGRAGAEISGIKKDGQRFPVAFISSQFVNVNGEERFSSLLLDISEQKKTEEQLLLSEKRFKSLVQNGADLFAIIDAQGVSTYISPTVKNIMGYEPEYLIGKSNLDFIHPDDLEVAMKALEKIGTTKLMELPVYRFKHNSGEWRWVQSTITNYLNDPAINGIVVNSRDVTEKQKLAEAVSLEKIVKQKEITEAVIAAQESERSQIGRELHDNVNQLLTAVKLYIDMAKTDEKNKEAFLNSASTYTITAIEEIRKLSQTLITPSINEIGLKDSIKNLAEDLMMVHPIKIYFDANDFSEENLNEKYKLNVFRIIQEQINNVLKHAKAKNIYIDFEEKKNKLFVSISDDGIGFDTTKRKRGIGITNIISRAELYKGEVSIVSEPGKGCRLTIGYIKSDLILN